MSELHITRGLPASGKTTWALGWVAEGIRGRVNRDDLRQMMFGRAVLSYSEEQEISIAQRSTALRLLNSGRDVVADDMNLRPRYVREWVRFASAHGHTVSVHEFPLTVEESVNRDRDRGGKVGEQAILGMRKYLTRGELTPLPDDTFTPPAKAATYAPDPSLPSAWIVDIDGTLALNTGGRSPYDLSRVSEDTPNLAVISIVQALAWSGDAVVYCSGREATCREDTARWIEAHVGIHGTLFMREEGDNRRDSIVKRELLDQIGNLYAVRGVIDDRTQVVRMWREAGLTCLQVADGDF